MVYDTGTLIFAFSLTILAGLSTGIGSALAFFAKTTNTRFLTASLGFSAGVMIYVSLVEIFVKARDSLEAVLGPFQGYMMTTLAFFAGIALIAIIDFLVPSFENPHEIRNVEEIPDHDLLVQKQKLNAWVCFPLLPLPSIIFPKALPPLWGLFQILHWG
jgi:zinc transporter, ZIP family